MRRSRRVAQFLSDPRDAVLDALWDSADIDAPIPADALARLPYWACYVPIGRQCETRISADAVETVDVHGALLALLWDKRAQAPMLHLFLDATSAAGERLGFGAAIPLDATRSLRDILFDTISYGVEASAGLPTIAGLYARAAQIALYLCADNAEARPATPAPQAAAPRPAGPQRAELHAARRETVWAVGWRIGSAIRRAEAAVRAAGESSGASGGRTLRPHMRRAHWHGYRVGPGRTAWKTVWLPPIPVNMPEDADSSAWADLLPVTQRRIS